MAGNPETGRWQLPPAIARTSVLRGCSFGFDDVLQGVSGTVTLPHAGQLHHIGTGRTPAVTHVLLLVQDLHIRIINAATGELLRELTLGPSRNYQPTGRPPGPTPGTSRKR